MFSLEPPLPRVGVGHFWVVGGVGVLVPKAPNLFFLFDVFPVFPENVGGCMDGWPGPETSPGDRVYPKTCNYCIRLYPRI